MHTEIKALQGKVSYKAISLDGPPKPKEFDLDAAKLLHSWTYESDRFGGPTLKVVEYFLRDPGNGSFLRVRVYFRQNGLFARIFLRQPALTETEFPKPDYEELSAATMRERLLEAKCKDHDVLNLVRPLPANVYKFEKKGA